MDQDDCEQPQGEATSAVGSEGDVSTSSEQQYHADLIPPFLPDQRVFCFDLTKKEQVSPKSAPDANGSTANSQQQQEQERYYEAVVRQVRHHPNVANPKARWSCLVHYQGWNARWDHWVSPSELVPDTVEHRQRYEEQQRREETKRQAEAQKQKQQQQQKKQKRKEQQQSTTVKSDNESYCSLPFTLRTVLVDEWEKISRRGFDAPHGFDNDLQESNSRANNTPESSLEGVKTTTPARSVHSLPAAVTVRQLLKHFEKKERKKWQQKLEEQEQERQKASSEATGGKESTKEILQKETIPPSNPKQEIRQFCRGLGRLFEEALPVCLLYPEERPQYQHYVKEGNNHAIDVCGCEFFLRLLVRLPLLLQRPLERPSLLTDLIVLLQQNRPACIKCKFRPPEYPHEWLHWEKKFYGDPRQSGEKQKEPTMEEEEADSSDSDLFS